MFCRKTTVAILLSTAMLSVQPAIAQTAPATAAAETPHDRLFRLFKESDEAQLKRNPIFGIFRGDLRYADQFGDYITEEYYAKEKAASEADLAALRAIGRASLNPTDQLSYEVFEFTTLDTLAEHIEKSERKEGKSKGDAERIAWATVNKQDGGGKKSGSGRSHHS